MVHEPFLEAPPQGDMVTAYDLAQLRRYLCLLDFAEDKAATWQEAVRNVFGLDPAQNPAHARKVYDTHLMRARWMTAIGYRQLAQIEGMNRPSESPR